MTTPLLNLPGAVAGDGIDAGVAAHYGSFNAVQRALENGDVASIRAMAQRMRSSVGGSMTVVARAAETPVTTQPQAQVQPSGADLRELQAIEDLLTGTEQERREGLDRLHQIIRRLRQ